MRITHGNSYNLTSRDSVPCLGRAETVSKAQPTGGLSQRRGEEKQSVREGFVQPNCPDQDGAQLGTVLRPGPLEIFYGSAETQPHGLSGQSSLVIFCGFQAGKCLQWPVQLGPWPSAFSHLLIEQPGNEQQPKNHRIILVG